MGILIALTHLHPHQLMVPVPACARGFTSSNNPTWFLTKMRMLYSVPIKAVQEGERAWLQSKADEGWVQPFKRSLAAPGHASTLRRTQDGEEQDELHSVLVELEAHGFGVEDRADEIPFGCAKPCGRGEGRKRMQSHRSEGRGFIPAFPLNPLPVRVTTASTSLPT